MGKDGVFEVVEVKLNEEVTAGGLASLSSSPHGPASHAKATVTSARRRCHCIYFICAGVRRGCRSRRGGTFKHMMHCCRIRYYYRENNETKSQIQWVSFASARICEVASCLPLYLDALLFTSLSQLTSDQNYLQ